MLVAAERFSTTTRMAIGIALAAFAAGAQLALSLLLGSRLPFIVFIPTVALTAAFLGWAPALVVLGTGAVYGVYILDPIYTFAVDKADDQAAWAVFLSVGIIFVYFGGMVRRLAKRARAAEHALVEQQLRQEIESAELLRDLFKQAPGFMTILRGPEHTFVFENQAHARLHGYRDVIGKTVREAFPDVSGQGVQEALDRVFQSGVPFQATEQRLVFADDAGGTAEHFVDFVFQPIFQRDGQVSGVFVEGFDVTAQKRSRDALRESEARLCEGLEAARMALWEWDIASGAVTMFENADQVFGIPAAQDCLPWASIHPEDRAKLDRLRDEVLATGSTSSVTVRVSRHAEERPGWLELRATPVRDTDGAVAKLRGLALDVTLEKQAEAFASEQEVQRIAADERATEMAERLALAIDAANLGVFYCPMPLETIYWNDTCKAHFFLPSDAEVDIDLFYALLHPDDRAKTRLAIETAVFNRQTYDVEYRTVAPDGRTRWIRAKGHAYYDELGQPVRFDGITIDIQKQKEAERDLELANRQKDDFLAMLAHELRNPLAPISSASALLSMSAVDRDRTERCAAIIARQVAHMTVLLDDLLDVSRVTRGKIELERGVVDIKSVLSAAAEQVLPLIKRKQHRLTMQITPERTHVVGDEKRLVQVFANLLTNAARYTPDHGAVDVVLSTAGDDVVVEVRDNGIGMSPELVERAFDLFVQGERTLDRQQGGLGIGLSLVRSLVELHGGRVDAHSDGPGRGSHFTVFLRSHVSEEGVAAHVSGLPASLAARSMLVMVVDDNEDAAKALSMLLEAVGYSVVMETDPVQALADSRTLRPDVFILDIGMPNMDGFELARHLRAQPETEDASIVAVSGYGQTQDIAAATSAGFDHHLVKPVNIAAFTTWLNGLAGKQQGSGELTPP
jgi:PAS domain S-box-containing protein